jgi:hypothetical protein
MRLGFRRSGVSGSHLPLEPIEVVADGHSKGQQLFKRLLRLIEGYADPAGLQGDTRGEMLELLRHNLNRGLDEKLGPCEAIFLQLRQNFGDVTAAADAEEELYRRAVDERPGQTLEFADDIV